MKTNRRKVVLYNPRAVFYTMPLALLAIGSELDPEEYEVVIIDGRLDPDAEQTVISALDNAVCLGVTVLTGAPIADALQVSRAAKAAQPGVPVVWGGWHPSMFGADCLREPCVDIAVQAQGEATFADIVSRLATGKSLEGCTGCIFRRGDGSVQINPPRAMIPLDVFQSHALIGTHSRSPREAASGCDQFLRYRANAFALGEEGLVLKVDVIEAIPLPQFRQPLYHGAGLNTHPFTAIHKRVGTKSAAKITSLGGDIVELPFSLEGVVALDVYQVVVVRLEYIERYHRARRIDLNTIVATAIYAAGASLK